MSASRPRRRPPLSPALVALGRKRALAARDDLGPEPGAVEQAEILRMIEAAKARRERERAKGARP